MSVRVVFFANIREAFGQGEVDINLPEDAAVSDLISLLRDQFGEAADLLTAENTRVAVDQELINGNVKLAGVREVAFFPPVTGG